MAEMEMLTTRSRDKDMLIAGFKRDLAKAADEIGRLRAALATIDRLNDHPGRFNTEIEAVLRGVEQEATGTAEK